MSMEKKRNSCPVDACGKFFRAIAANSPFRPIRRISNHHHHHHPQDSMPSNPKPVVAAAEVVPIKFEYSAPGPYAKPASTTTSQLPKNGKVASGLSPNKNTQPPISQFVQAKKISTKHKAEAAAAQEKRYRATTGSRMESSNNKTNANSITEEDEFSKYIKRAGNKIRTPSSVGGAGKINASSATAGGATAGKDHFSDYIDRAKKRMLRTMSSFVGARTDSK